MKQEEIKRDLCCYDKRNPDYDSMLGEPMADRCSCDNCFCGLHELASHTLALTELLDKAMEIIADDCNACPSPLGDTACSTCKKYDLILKVKEIGK